jgi:hypothetical protein
MDSSFLFPRRVDSAIAGLEEAKNLAGESPPPDSDPFNGVEFGEKPACLSRQFAAKANPRFEFEKRGQQFIRSHNVTFPVAPMCVRNPDCSPR